MNINKNQLISACVLLVLGAGPVLLAKNYNVTSVIPSSVTPDLLGSTQIASISNMSIVETETAEAPPYIITPGELNLAYYFPNGADKSNRTESYAGKAFQVLMGHDESWISKIYDYADATPLQMATSLGRTQKQVTGKYNYKDEKHDPKNPDTWTVNSFKKIRMSFTNGDGKVVNAYSNVIDIMSMANIYTYFKGAQDYDLFVSYSKELWDKSHSYTVGISDLYYCNGCMGDDAEKRELEELAAEAEAEAASGYTRTTENGLIISELTETTVETSENKETSIIETQTGSAVIQAGGTKQTTEAPSVPEETIPESTSGVIVSGSKKIEETSANLEEQIESNSVEESFTEIETLPQEETTIEHIDLASSSDASIETTAETEAETKGKASILCPGHVDLIVNAKVIGIKEEHGLFEKDSIGNDPSNINEDGWPGWKNYTKASARLLGKQDWFEKYGLSLSVISMRNPLTESEIESYMNQLPETTSQTRKDIIQFALTSVGKVPYYWGGKPSSQNYTGNSFGILTTPDEKGRVLKGLDCSGWINWVYWSVTGNRLPYEGTSGLAILGTKINRSELQPGDIIVRTGADAHVIMFLGWTADGQIRCIHESSAGVNNVTVGIRDANWPYYRKLVD